MNRQQTAVAGAACIILGAVLMHQAYEASGRPRPLWARFLPG